MDHVRADLCVLASVLADWAADAPGVKLYLFGSRVRGDHHSKSDVDVSVEFVSIGERERKWWSTNNDDLFATIDARLPGKLQILDDRRDAATTFKFRAGHVVYQGPQRLLRATAAERRRPLALSARLLAERPALVFVGLESVDDRLELGLFRAAFGAAGQRIGAAH
jgi:predicted nucleotidyltransferase